MRTPEFRFLQLVRVNHYPIGEVGRVMKVSNGTDFGLTTDPDAYLIYDVNLAGRDGIYRYFEDELTAVEVKELVDK